MREQTIVSVGIYQQSNPLYEQARWPCLRAHHDDDVSVISLPSFPDAAGRRSRSSTRRSSKSTTFAATGYMWNCFSAYIDSIATLGHNMFGT